MSTIRMIKADAQIVVTFGVPFIQKLQSLLLYLSEDRSLEELNRFKEIAEKQEEFPEVWMEHFQTIIILVREIEATVEKSGQFTEVNPDSLTTQ